MNKQKKREFQNNKRVRINQINITIRANKTKQKQVQSFISSLKTHNFSGNEMLIPDPSHKCIGEHLNAAANTLKHEPTTGYSRLQQATAGLIRL